MNENPVQFSYSQTCGALNARSLKSSYVSHSSGCGVLARDRGFPICNHEQGRFTLSRICAFLSGYRGLASVLQNSPCRVADVFDLHAPSLISFQGTHCVLKPIEGFLAWVTQNFSQWNINWLRSAKL